MNGMRCADSPGRVVSFGQVIIDLTIRVGRVPHPGEDVYADRAGVAVGAGFNALYAVRRMGVDAVYAGALGTGPWSDRIRAALEREGIAHGGVTDREDDNGFCIALTDADAERTFVSVRGAETRLGPHGFDNVAVGAGDVAIFSGYTLIHRSAEALSAFMRRTAGHDFPAVSDDGWELLLPSTEDSVEVLVDGRPAGAAPWPSGAIRLGGSLHAGVNALTVRITSSAANHYYRGTGLQGDGPARCGLLAAPVLRPVRRWHDIDGLLA